ncbi:MAG TPA: HAD-IIIA family hydrolase [Saprospiraceae bacterium]|nr:HAD-IIIA family hydrolase [Saprospiraceae bacterium]
MEENSLKNKASRIKMLVLDVDGTLTDGGIYINANGVHSKKFNIRDGMGIKQLQEVKIHVAFLTHSHMQMILDERAKMLDVKFVYSGKDPKIQVLQGWMQELSLVSEEIAYIGDDINDLEIMKQVGLSACPADAHHRVIREVDIVLQRKGGEGCVREFIDRFLLRQND